MDAISYAVSRIRLNIPLPILQAAFRVKGSRHFQSLFNLDESIKQEVIHPVVLLDCSLNGGDEQVIPLTRAKFEQVDDLSYLYRFPKSATNDKSIVSAIGLEYSNPQSSMFMSPTNLTNQAPLSLQMGRSMVDVFSPMPTTFNPRVRIVSENTILVSGYPNPPMDRALRCTLEYDKSISSLQAAYYSYFKDLCVLAVKQYVYNSYILEMGEVELAAGRELGRFAQIVDGYSDAGTQYDEYLKMKWRKVVLLNDQESLHSLYRLQVRPV